MSQNENIKDKPDCTGYIVACSNGENVRSVANFREKENAIAYVEFMRQAMLKKDIRHLEVGFIQCNFDTAIWSSLDRNMPKPPPKKEKSRIITP